MTRHLLLLLLLPLLATGQEKREAMPEGPLPDGALARMGSVRFQTVQPSMHLVFAPDGRTVATSMVFGYEILLWDVQTGLVRARLPHLGGMIAHLRFTDDSESLISVASGNEAIRTWETKTGKLICEVAGEARPRGEMVDAYALSPDLKQFAEVTVGYPDEAKLRIRSVADGKEIWTAAVRGRSEVKLAYAPDGSWIALGGATAGVAIIDTERREEIRRITLADPMPKVPNEFSEGYDKAKAVAVSPDGRTGVTVWERSRKERDDQDKVLQIWRWDDDGERREIVFASGRESWSWMDGVAFSPDGKHLVTWGNALIVWDTKTWEERFRRVDLRPSSVAFSPDGESVVIDVGVIRFLDVATGEPRGATDVGHQYPIREVALTPDGRQVISGDGLSTIHTWEATTGRLVSTAPGVGWDLLSLEIDPTGRYFMAASLHEVTRLCRIGDKKPLREFPGIPPFVRNRETVFRWGPAGEYAHPKPEEKSLTSHAFAPDGASLALGTRKGVVEVRDLSSGEIRESVDAHEGAVLLVEYGSSGRFLYSLGADDLFRQWTVDPLKSTRTWKVDGVDEQGFADIALGVNRLATADRHGKLHLFDLDLGGKIGEYEIHDKRLARMEFSPDGNLIVTRGTERWDDPEQRWGVEFGPGYREMCFQFLDGLDGHKRFERRLASDPFTARDIDDGRPVAFSEDGRYVALAERDRSDRAKMMIRPAIGIWEVATEQRVLQLRGHQGDVLALSFSADGRSLVSGANDKVVYLWMLDPDPETPGRTTAKDLEKLWKDLGGKDARAGYAAVWDLTARGSDAALFLRDQILGLLDLPVEDLRRQLADLNHDDFGRREQASAELQRWGALARPLLLKAIEQAGAPEEVTRLRQIVDRIRLPVQRFPNEHLRLVRAIEALERMPEDVSLDALRTIAGRDGDDLGARQAQAALARLEAKEKLK